MVDANAIIHVHHNRRFSVIEDDILLDKRISPDCIAIYAFIGMNDSGVEEETLMERFGFDRERLYKALAELHAGGYLPSAASA